jgi:ABC-type transport system involved in Fe-S cluster assembly fused permease/ATPase subunit
MVMVVRPANTRRPWCVFVGRTTITIAHRLDTIIYSDKVLAMAGGVLKVGDY